MLKQIEIEESEKKKKNTWQDFVDITPMWYTWHIMVSTNHTLHRTIQTDLSLYKYYMDWYNIISAQFHHRGMIPNKLTRIYTNLRKFMQKHFFILLIIIKKKTYLELIVLDKMYFQDILWNIDDSYNTKRVEIGHTP